MKQNEKRQQTIEILRHYKSRQQTIELLKADLRTLELMDGQTQLAVDYARPTSGKTNKVISPTENAAIQLEEKRCQLLRQIALLKNQNDKVDMALSRLGQSHQTLLKMRYIDNCRWNEIYKSLNYSEEYIRGKMQEIALDKMSQWLFPEMYTVPYEA